MSERFRRIPAGTPVIVGDSVVPMPRLDEGDRLVPVHRTGDLLTIPAKEWAVAREAVERAQRAFEALAGVPAETVTSFFGAFAARLEDDAVWARIAGANADDVERARIAGRSTARLAVSAPMRNAMAAGLRAWAAAPSRLGEVIERRSTPTWTVERRRAPLGVVAFVFEGRPNVFADGAGVLRGGNASVMRIGSDALTTAVAIEEHALAPALAASGLPDGAVTLVRSRAHASAHALFCQPLVRLAIARGSGPAVALLGSIAEQHGIPASLHGTGGAWLYVADDAPEAAAANAIAHSLDRKVCNTLNVLLLAPGLSHLVPEGARLHVAVGTDLPDELFGATMAVVRAEGEVVEPRADFIPLDGLRREWEWESTPEISIATVPDDEAAVAMINSYSPKLVAGIVTADPSRLERFYERVDVPHVGNGFTRWVDGQWAWGRPELGLTNWERGRVLGRSGILSGDDVYTVRDVFRDTTAEAPQRR